MNSSKDTKQLSKQELWEAMKSPVDKTSRRVGYFDYDEGVFMEMVNGKIRYYYRHQGEDTEVQEMPEILKGLQVTWND